MFGFGDKQDQPQEQHPALSGFSRMREMAKSFLHKTFGGGIKGGLIGAVALPVIVGGAIMMGAASVPFLAPVLGYLGVTTGAGQGYLMGLALKGAAMGAGLGGAIGAAKGLSNAGDDADAAQQTAIMKWQRAQQQQANIEMMEQNRQRMAAMGVQQPAMGMGIQTPQVPFGAGMGGPQQRM